MHAEWGRRIGLRVVAIAVLGVLWQVTAIVMDKVSRSARSSPASTRSSTRSCGSTRRPGGRGHIVGVSEAESRGILDLLYAHLTKPEHIVRHRWRAGDVAMWDNRSTAHYANRDYGTAHRVMHRITLRGDVPVGPAAG